ncbi:MAG: ACT domain-containing protein [Chloroflexi bacterium]|nr:ACT domain-containing protein [Chloroflexota bacterium]
MEQTVEQALSQANLVSDGTEYALVKLPPKAITAAAGVIAAIGEPFCALIADRNEVSLLIPAEAVQDFVSHLPGHTLAETRYRLITLDVALELSLVGFMAAVSRALADAGVSILPYAAFTRDHLLVPAAQFELAMKTLQQLKSARP